MKRRKRRSARTARGNEQNTHRCELPGQPVGLIEHKSHAGDFSSNVGSFPRRSPECSTQQWINVMQQPCVEQRRESRRRCSWALHRTRHYLRVQRLCERAHKQASASRMPDLERYFEPTTLTSLEVLVTSLLVQSHGKEGVKASLIASHHPRRFRLKITSG